VDLLAVDSNAQNQPSTLPILQRQLTHLHRLVDDLLDASRLQQRRLELRSDPLDLVEVIEAAIQDTRHVFAKAGPELKASLPSQPVCLTGDRVRLVQVFVNLLRNAAKFTPVGGRVTITIELDGESARVRIEDTGEGIPADAIEHIFELFRQAQSTHSNAGFGIGLALAHEITTLHGGKIEARSAGVGCGATFEVRLPLDEQPESAVDQKTRTLQIDQFAHRVLLVEDQPDVAEAMGMLLETVVAKVHVATSAEQALALFPQLDVNVVLTDIGLQDMSGMELAGRLLEAATHRPPSLIALSGWGDESTRRAAEQAGFKGFLRKPLDLEALRDLLTEIDVSAP
jgi:CheY-like chemotaxis protein